MHSHKNNSLAFGIYEREYHIDATNYIRHHNKTSKGFFKTNANTNVNIIDASITIEVIIRVALKIDLIYFQNPTKNEVLYNSTIIM